MPKKVQLRRGTTAQHASFTGADGEITVDTTLRELRLHDGATVGGKLLGYILRTPASVVTVQTLAGCLVISGGDEETNALEINNLFNFLGGGTIAKECMIWRLSHVHASLSYATSVQLHFSDTSQTNFRSVALTGNITFTTAGLAAGRIYILKIASDGSSRNFTFPSWKFIGAAAPASIAANKVALLRLYSFGTTDADVIARYEVEP